MPKYLTAEGLEKLKTELEYLKTVKRKEIAERLKHAISFGDLKENAAYHEAKDAQGFLEGKISELRAIVADAVVLKNNNDGVARLGSVVLVVSGKDKEKFQLVAPEEADIMAGKISHKSPLGEALLGKVRGDKARVKIPKGETEYEVLEIQ